MVDGSRIIAETQLPNSIIDTANVSDRGQLKPTVYSNLPLESTSGSNISLNDRVHLDILENNEQLEESLNTPENVDQEFDCSVELSHDSTIPEDIVTTETQKRT